MFIFWISTYVTNEKKIVIGTFIYDTSSFEEKRIEDVLNKQEVYIRNSRLDEKDYKEKEARAYINKNKMKLEFVGKIEESMSM